MPLVFPLHDCYKPDTRPAHLGHGRFPLFSFVGDGSFAAYSIHLKLGILPFQEDTNSSFFILTYPF